MQTKEEMLDIYERPIKYEKDHCWQYEIKKSRLEEDKQRFDFSDEYINNLGVSDFEFRYVDKSDKEECRKIEKFIERYEWLGKTHIWSTHRFACYHNGKLGGVVIMSTPNSFSNIIGEENRGKEKLISRGASASWAPKNLGSWLIMKSIDWMSKNTEYVLFTAYSDPEAKELGTIYQACNFYYLGQQSGNKKVYLDPKRKHLGWIGSRSFTYRSCYVNYARELGYEFNHDEWLNDKRKLDWDSIPNDIEQELRQYAKDYRNSCESRVSPPKHKYAYIKGKNKTETNKYKRIFEELNNIKEYPKER